jgi:hypothetical protein
VKRDIEGGISGWEEGSADQSDGEIGTVVDGNGLASMRICLDCMDISRKYNIQ